MSYRKRRAPNKGKKCTRYKRVKMRGNGYVRRCAKYGGRSAGYTKRRKRSKSRRGFRRGHRPYNKGKKCREWGVNKRGRVQCRSFGKVYGGKYKNRRRSKPGVSPVRERSYENKIWGAMQRAQEQRHSEPDVPAWWAM